MIQTDTRKRSSNIAQVLYDPANLALTITFKSGGTYRHANVTPLDHMRFMASASLGKAYNQMFYGQPKLHPATKLAPTSGH